MIAAFQKNSRIFLGGEGGSTAVEFGILSLLFVALMLGVIDLGRLTWEFNSAKAAARAGARLAIVSPMLPTYLQGYSALQANPPAVSGNGLPVPLNAVPTFVCYGSSSTCLNSGGASNGMDTATFNKIVVRMKKYYPRLKNANIAVEYRHIGLGVAGNPCAPDVEPLITVKISGLPFQPASLRVFGVTTFNIPPVRSSFTGESLGRTSC